MMIESKRLSDSSGFPPSRRRLLQSAAAVTAFGAVSGAAAAPPAGVAAPADGNLQGKRLVGFMLAHEQFPVPELVELGGLAAHSGFDLLATSDHFQPWQANEEHCGEAWVTLAALGQRTPPAWLGTTVTCPILRYNPAVVAETFASSSLLYPGRVFLGVGSGEALNEAATGLWPKWPERRERLIEAIGIIRALWTGQPVAHRGKYYAVNGKLHNPPLQPIPLLTAANGKKSMRLAGQHGDGLITDPLAWKRFTADRNRSRHPCRGHGKIVRERRDDRQRSFGPGGPEKGHRLLRALRPAEIGQSLIAADRRRPG